MTISILNNTRTKSDTKKNKLAPAMDLQAIQTVKEIDQNSSLIDKMPVLQIHNGHEPVKHKTQTMLVISPKKRD